MAEIRPVSSGDTAFRVGSDVVAKTDTPTSEIEPQPMQGSVAAGVLSDRDVSSASLKASLDPGLMAFGGEPKTNPAVDNGIKKALQLEHTSPKEAVAVMKDIVHQHPDSAKAQHFLAREMRAQEHSESDPKVKAGLHTQMLQHERAASRMVDLQLQDKDGKPAPDGPFSGDVLVNKKEPDNQEWAVKSRDFLRNEVLKTPCLNQYNEGGNKPGSYCGPTSIRMALRQQGIQDPGAEEVATGGKHPAYTSSGFSAATGGERARELGLPNASGADRSLQDIVHQLNLGRAVPVGGVGTFTAAPGDANKVFAGGTSNSHTFAAEGHWMTCVGYNKDEKTGEIKSLIVNDPSTGKQLEVNRDDFMKFFKGSYPGIASITYGD